jgi:cobalt-zinc-cadmium efflux system membrane fusion protein
LPIPDGAPVPGVVTLSQEAIASSGIRTVSVTTGRLNVALEVAAEVQLNPDRVAHVSSLVPGQLMSVDVTVGDEVRAGQRLARMRSVELGQARASLRRASALRSVASQNRDRQEALRAEGISSERSLLEAQLALDEAQAESQAAQSRLRVFGVRGGSGPDLSLQSPISGVVVERHATRGENVSSADTLFVVADLSPVWVIGRVYEQQVAQVREGMSAVLSLNAYPGRTWPGQVSFVGAMIDESTRTLSVRVEIDNTDGSLRPGLFGSLELSQGDEGDTAVVVPLDAVQQVENRPVVFVPGVNAGEFRAQDVTLGRQSADRIEIIEGLRQGERVVVAGAFILKSEVMSYTLGSGCAH